MLKSTLHHEQISGRSTGLFGGHQRGAGAEEGVGGGLLVSLRDGPLRFLLFPKPTCKTALRKAISNVHRADGLPASDLGSASPPSWSICPPPAFSKRCLDRKELVFSRTVTESKIGPAYLG